MISLTQNEKSPHDLDTVISVITPGNGTSESDHCSPAKTNPAYIDDLDSSNDPDLKKVTVETVQNGHVVNGDLDDCKKLSNGSGQNSNVSMTGSGIKPGTIVKVVQILTFMVIHFQLVREVNGYNGYGIPDIIPY